MSTDSKELTVGAKVLTLTGSKVPNRVMLDAVRCGTDAATKNRMTGWSERRCSPMIMEDLCWRGAQILHDHGGEPVGIGEG